LWISQRDFTRLARAFPHMETYFKDYIEKTFGGSDMVFAPGSAERSHELERTH
jgi:NADH dehydrogenase